MANLLINDELWSSISPEEQNAIIARLHADGVLPREDTVVGDANTSPDNLKSAGFGPLCRLKCEVEHTFAVKRCDSTTSGPAHTQCITAANAAYNQCRNACG